MSVSPEPSSGSLDKCLTYICFYSYIMGGTQPCSRGIKGEKKWKKTKKVLDLYSISLVYLGAGWGWYGKKSEKRWK